MKKLFILLAFIAVASFTSCTDLNNEDELLIEQTQAVEKDKVDPRDNEDPDDTEG
ncbi:hypothetical protein PL373_14390 [Tenacibaculum maritimum]|nr:hypothetical protein [Tenacibaculum maritimum]MDB0602307.1 hypothetical protein [Tenacibaculum maritimum]MDB0612443.1 hypothetical protein [Tenacibaculum maritimum]